MLADRNSQGRDERWRHALNRRKSSWAMKENGPEKAFFIFINPHQELGRQRSSSPIKLVKRFHPRLSLQIDRLIEVKKRDLLAINIWQNKVITIHPKKSFHVTFVSSVVLYQISSIISIDLYSSPPDSLPVPMILNITLAIALSMISLVNLAGASRIRVAVNRSSLE